MKKWEKIAFAALSSVLLLIPVYTMPFMGQSSDADNAEKRELAQKPALFTDGKFNIDFFDEMGDYLADHFTLRGELVSAQSDLKGLFGVSSKEDVVMGKDGWLYFDKTMPDYMGETTLSDTQLQRLHRTADLMAEYVEGQGATFVLTVAPNKATIYPEYVPYYYPAGSSPTPLCQINQVLKEESWYVDLTTALTAQKDTQLYHKRDSHWNNLGARIGYDALMTAAGGNAGAYADTPYTIEKVWDGDLDKLLGNDYKDEQAVWQREFTYDYTTRYRDEEQKLITTACDSGEGHLLMYRDSFANALVPLLAEQYATATFSRDLPYNLTAVTEGNTVIVEIVERNLTNLLIYAPKMAAPLRDMPTATDEGKYISATATKNGNYLKVSGLTNGVADRIYLAVDGVAYEATPVAEGDATADNGFTAYLPADCAGKTITLLCERDGVWMTQGTIN